NFHVAFGRAPALAPLLAAGILLVFAGPWILPLVSPRLLTFSALALALAGRLELARRWGVPARAPYLAPLGAAVVAWILARAAWRVVRGESVEWKGRAV